MCIFKKLFRKKETEFRIVKETRAVKESADGQNLMLQTFYLPQVRESYRLRKPEWKPLPVGLARPAYGSDDSFADIYKKYYDRHDCQFGSEELARTMIDCYTFSETYRGYTIRKIYLTHYGTDKSKDRVVWYVGEDNDFARVFDTYEEVKEGINSRNPQVVNSETINL